MFTTNAIDDKPLPLYASTENRREWIHVLDHCRGIERVLLDGRVGETYNVGTGVERSIEQIADARPGSARQTVVAEDDRSRPSGPRPPLRPRLDQDLRDRARLGAADRLRGRPARHGAAGTPRTARGGSRFAAARPVVEDAAWSDKYVVVTGAGGLLGGRSLGRFERAGATVHGFAHARPRHHRRGRPSKGSSRRPDPTLVVHPAAMTNVDACELEPDRAWAVNAARAAQRRARRSAGGSRDRRTCPPTTSSTATKGGYTESDETNPIQVYGSSKLGGEHGVREANARHFIVRSAWIYGPGGKNFLSKLPELADGESINAVVDQNGSPTFAPDLADALIAAGRDAGLRACTTSSTRIRCSFAEFCRFGLEILGSRARDRRGARRRPRAARAQAARHDPWWPRPGRGPGSRRCVRGAKPPDRSSARTHNSPARRTAHRPKRACAISASRRRL